MFQVTTVLPLPHDPISKMPLIDRLVNEEEEKKAEADAAAKKGEKKPKFKKVKVKKPKGEAGATDQDGAEDAKQDEVPVVEPKKEEPLIPFEERKVNYKKDIFGKPSFLTVSGQLNVENYCCALTDCYTFGPTFRAENSHTSRHLAEFWMIEPELAFATLEDDM